MDRQEAARMVYDHLGRFDSTSLKGRVPVIQIETEVDGRWYEIELEVTGCCDITAELAAQDADDRRYEDEPDYDHGNDVITWDDIARWEA